MQLINIMNQRIKELGETERVLIGVVAVPVWDSTSDNSQCMAELL